MESVQSSVTSFLVLKPTHIEPAETRWFKAV
jgi:hypothetical protein